MRAESPNLSPAGTACDSPARKCGVGAKDRNKSRRDGTNGKPSMIDPNLPARRKPRRTGQPQFKIGPFNSETERNNHEDRFFRTHSAASHCGSAGSEPLGELAFYADGSCKFLVHCGALWRSRLQRNIFRPRADCHGCLRYPPVCCDREVTSYDVQSAKSGYARVGGGPGFRSRRHKQNGGCPVLCAVCKGREPRTHAQPRLCRRTRVVPAASLPALAKNARTGHAL